jgi:hypothetical protein
VADCKGCDVVGPPAVDCRVCGRTKAPVGRSVPVELPMCDDDCPGYRSAPLPSSLWPGERWGDSLPCVHRG